MVGRNKRFCFYAWDDVTNFFTQEDSQEEKPKK
jgi:hypothetical protein